MITYEAKSGKCLEISFIISAGAKRDHESPLQNSSEADSERREKPYLVRLCKQMKREPKRLTGTQGRKSQIKSVFRLRVCYLISLFFVT